MRESDFIKKARVIHNFHVSKRKEFTSWRLEETAGELKISIGSLSEYLLIASWLKTHYDDVNRCDSKRQALLLIKELQRKLELREV